MDQLKNLLLSLSLRQRVFIGVMAVVAGAGIWGLVHWNRERDFKPLYSNLASEDAGAIVAKLRESATEYRLAENGGEILVPSAKVAELRLQLAAAGLPKSGRIGYELFDKANFGQTDFAEQVNYRRALEGELERSIVSIGEIEQARVHLTFAKDSMFAESKQPAKASVLVKLKPGKKLGTPSVDAVKHLISSAVEALQPEMVSVVDNKGQLLRGTQSDSREGEASDRMLEYRKHMEQSLLEKVNSTLEPLLGGQRFRAGVTVDCDFSSGEQSEETFDPSKSVMVSSQRSEDAGTTGATAGVPGTAPNLPRPPARPANGSGTLSRRTENVTFQTSRTVKHTKTPEGAVKRISVAVLVDQRLRWEVAAGKPKRVLEAPSAPEIKALKDVVSGVVGFEANRGDQIVVESIPFDATLAAEPPAGLVPPPPTTSGAGGQPSTAEPFWKRKDLLLPAGVGAAVAILLIVMLIIFLRKRRKKKVAVHVDAQGHVIEGAAGTDGHGHKQIPHASGGGAGGRAEEPGVSDEEAQAIREAQAREILGSIKLPESTTKKGEVLTKHIREEVKKSPEAVAYVVRTWLNSVPEDQ